MAAETCPGCGELLTDPKDCDHCEYFNLASGRNHYCGRDECYCRELRRTMKREVLGQFAARHAATFAGWQALRVAFADRPDLLHPGVGDFIARTVVDAAWPILGVRPAASETGDGDGR
jgi:hypothetical protein